MNKLPLSAMAALLLITFNLSFSTARAQGTAFTYQGRLNDVSGPANGTYDFGFTLYATNVTGLPVAAPVFAAGTVVSNGLFITTLDFGPGAFTGTSNWLDIEVRTNGALLFAELSPRQMITPTPYALVAATLSGVVSSQNLPGFLATNNYDAIGGGFNNVNSPAGRNTIGGGSGNSTGGPGDNDELDTIGGGMGNMIQSSQYGTIGGGQNNLVGAYYGTVGGGANNQASGYIGTVAGGDNNWASGQYAFVGGGLENKAYADYSAVAGGYYNVAFGVGAFIGGGGNDGKHIPGNTANGPGSVIGGGVGNVTGSLATNSVVPGGFQNSVGGSFSFAAGQQAQATNQGTFVWADSQNAPFASTADNQFSVRAAGGVRLVTTGAGMSLDGPVNANAFVGNGGGLTNVNLGIAGLNSNDVKFVGADNVYLGQGAGNFNVSNAGDTALGANALGNLNNNSELTVGADNTALGSGALAQTVSGTGNTAVGQGALAGNTNGNANVALGSEAGYLITGNNNVDIANPGLATDSGIIRIGTPGAHTATYLAGTLYGNGGGLTNVNTGIAGLNTNDVKFVGGNNVYLGQGAGNFNVSNAGDTALGANALGNLNNNSELTVGADNTALGSGALAQTVSGTGNTAVGQGALAGNTNGNANVALGSEAGYLITGNNNVDIANPGVATDSGIIRIGTPGAQTATYLAGTLYGNGGGLTNVNTGIAGLNTNDVKFVGGNNVYLGQGAGNFNVSNAGDTALGANALGNLNNNSELTVGADNTALGSGALAQTVSGTGNTAVGQGALAGNTNGNANVALGSEAGYLITGNNNVDIANPGVATDSGIIRIGTPGTQTATYLAGTVYANGLALTSDRNAKENFQPVDNQAVLARVAALPVTQWNYKTDHAGVRHIGPMAQDFQAAFGLDGADDRHISMVDEGGVALAAIQGLNEKLQEKDAEIAQLQAKAAQVDDLERQLHDLAAAVKALTQK